MDETCDEDVIPSSLEMQDVIKPIGKDTIHRICSGQVSPKIFSIILQIYTYLH